MSLVMAVIRRDGLLTMGSSYDPEYEQWEFGKLSALREIAFSLENHYPYYYMGWSATENPWGLG